jgi:hypothetical protein
MIGHDHMIMSECAFNLLSTQELNEISSFDSLFCTGDGCKGILGGPDCSHTCSRCLLTHQLRTQRKRITASVDVKLTF